MNDLSATNHRTAVPYPKLTLRQLRTAQWKHYTQTLPIYCHESHFTHIELVLTQNAYKTTLRRFERPTKLRKLGLTAALPRCFHFRLPHNRLRWPQQPPDRSYSERQSPTWRVLLHPHDLLLLDPRHHPPTDPQSHPPCLHSYPRCRLRVPAKHYTQ